MTKMNRMVKAALLSFGVALGLVSPAWAETPQTDVAFVEQLAAKSTEEALNALALYYDLHVSEIAVQAVREQNVGAFLAVERAKEDGDKAEAERQTALFESTGAALAAARQTNQDLRRDLAEMTGIGFADDLAMAPDAPDVLSPAPDGAPTELLKARATAWGAVETARVNVRHMRMKLLEDQEAYDQNREVKIGDSMRAMTRVEVDMARAACDLRLIDARIAAAIGKPLAEALKGL
jgi:hypothetical protein